MDILKTIKNKAKNETSTIVLPEANMDERVYVAAKNILKQKLAKIVVFGKEDEFDKSFHCENCQIIDIQNINNAQDFALQLYELRKHKGLTEQESADLIKNPIYYAVMMLQNNLADGIVAGAKFSTADILRPALQIIKTKPGKSIVTGNMLMIKKGVEPLIFADVSLVEDPSSEQLAEIAISNAEFMHNIIGNEPKVAMLSYSTKGSAKSAMVDKVVKATELAKQNSTYKIDGEMQADSALDVQTATRKGLKGGVKGDANVLVFPDLNAGNIGYKLVSRLGGYMAVGPIMLNFKKPVNDLSRGCTVDEIINTVCITSIMCKN